MPKYYTHVWTQNNAIIMLSSKRKIIITINVLYSIWKQYKIDIGQFCTETIGIRLTQFICLMFYWSHVISVSKSQMKHPWRWISEKRYINVMPKLCPSFHTFLLMCHLNATKHSIDKGYLSCRTPHAILNIEQIFSDWMFEKTKTIRSPEIIGTFFAFKSSKHYS